LQARVLFQVPSTAICWSVYEFFKYSLTKNELRNEGGITYEKPDKVSGDSETCYPVNLLKNSSNNAIGDSVTLGSSQGVIKEDLLPTGSAASMTLSAARALGAV
jgi:solute carrier family 25 iron transporter 28/37